MDNYEDFFTMFLTLIQCRGEATEEASIRVKREQTTTKRQEKVRRNA